MSAQFTYILIDQYVNINYPHLIKRELLKRTLDAIYMNLKPDAVDHQGENNRIAVKGYKVLDLVNTLGIAGWELVCVEGHQYWLKHREG